MQDGWQVEASFVAIEQCFADADHAAGDECLIDHFGVLAGAGSALMDDCFAHRLPARLERFDDFLVAADHDR